MKDVKKNKIITIAMVVLLIVFVVFSAILFNFIGNDDDNSSFKVTFDQLYNSEYDLHFLDKGIFFGTYENKLNVFIDKDGNEILKTDSLIEFDDYYKTSEGNYLFYSNIDKKLNIYIFDGKSFNQYHIFEKVSYVKPIVSNGVIIGFTSFSDDKLYLYSLEDDSVTVLYEETFISDNFINNVYYNNSNKYFVISNKEGKYGAISINGEYVIKPEYDDMISLNNDNFIVKNKKNKYGIVDNANNQIVECIYDGIVPYDNYYVFIKDGFMALYDEEYNNLTGFKMIYNDLLEFNYRKDLSIKLYVIGDKIIILNNNFDDFYKREYKNHDMYVIENGNIVADIKQVGFYSDKVICSYNDKYEFNIYNNDMKVIKSFKLENAESIDKINSVEYYNDDTLLINYSSIKDDHKKLYNYKGKNVVDEKRIVVSNSMYYVIEEKNKVSIYDYDKKKLSEIIGKINYVDNDFIIIDKVLYRIIVE